MKRIVLCCDGTWNTPDQVASDQSPPLGAGGGMGATLPARAPTNVAKVAEAVLDVDDRDVRQLLYYQRGVGTTPGERLRGGTFGVGLSRGVRDVYRFIVTHYEPGDELFFFGFSRGAYMARSACGLIRNAGVLQRDQIDRLDDAYALYRARALRPTDRESVLFRRAFSYGVTPIRFIGVWDTVGSLGIPLPGGSTKITKVLSQQWAFHDTTLSSKVTSAYHALAIDETREPFLPTLWHQQPNAVGQTLEQVWFTGVHCDVGGGYLQTGLSDIALAWMVDRATSCGLTLQPIASRATPRDEQAETGAIPFAPNPLQARHESRTKGYRLLPRAERPIAEPLTPNSADLGPTNEFIASSARQRWDCDPRYRPGNLDKAIRANLDTMPVPGL